MRGRFAFEIAPVAASWCDRADWWFGSYVSHFVDLAGTARRVLVASVRVHRRSPARTWPLRHPAQLSRGAVDDPGGIGTHLLEAGETFHFSAAAAVETWNWQLQGRPPIRLLQPVRLVYGCVHAAADTRAAATWPARGPRWGGSSSSSESSLPSEPCCAPHWCVGTRR
jgi:hypothetical protein